MLFPSQTRAAAIFAFLSLMIFAERKESDEEDDAQTCMHSNATE